MSSWKGMRGKYNKKGKFIVLEDRRRERSASPVTLMEIVVDDETHREQVQWFRREDNDVVDVEGDLNVMVGNDGVDGSGTMDRDTDDIPEDGPHERSASPVPSLASSMNLTARRLAARHRDQIREFNFEEQSIVDSEGDEAAVSVTIDRETNEAIDHFFDGIANGIDIDILPDVIAPRDDHGFCFFIEVSMVPAHRRELCEAVKALKELNKYCTAFHLTLETTEECLKYHIVIGYEQYTSAKDIKNALDARGCDSIISIVLTKKMLDEAKAFVYSKRNHAHPTENPAIDFGELGDVNSFVKQYLIRMCKVNKWSMKYCEGFSPSVTRENRKLLESLVSSDLPEGWNRPEVRVYLLTGSLKGRPVNVSARSF